MKLQISIEKMESILTAAKMEILRDTSLSHTVEFMVTKRNDTHTGSDSVQVEIKSSYQDGAGLTLLFNE